MSADMAERRKEMVQESSARSGRRVSPRGAPIKAGVRWRLMSVAVLLIALLLSACGGETPTNTPVAAPPTDTTAPAAAAPTDTTAPAAPTDTTAPAAAAPTDTAATSSSSGD